MVPRLLLAFTFILLLTGQGCETFNLDLTPEAAKECAECPEVERPDVPAVNDGGDV